MCAVRFHFESNHVLSLLKVDICLLHLLPERSIGVIKNVLNESFGWATFYIMYVAIETLNESDKSRFIWKIFVHLCDEEFPRILCVDFIRELAD